MKTNNKDDNDENECHDDMTKMSMNNMVRMQVPMQGQMI